MTFNRWFDFLELYLARQKPQLTAGQKGLAPVIYQTVFGIPGVTLPDDPIQAEPDYAAAKSAYEKLKQVRILFDNGAGSATPGQPYPGFERSFSRFPLPGTKARSFYLARGGRLSDHKPGPLRCGVLQMGPQRPPGDRLHRKHRWRRSLGRDP